MTNSNEAVALSAYQQQANQAKQHPEEFWLQQAAALPWFETPSTALERPDEIHSQWFPDGLMNTCFMALDHHVVSGRGEQIALYYDSPVTDTKQQWTYSELLQEVEQAAGMLSALGVTKGDRVLIYLPMIPQAAVAMLACARLGAIHSVVFGGFAANELAIRIDDAQPKVVISATCGIEIEKIIPYTPLLAKALALANHQPNHCVIVDREQYQSSEQLENQVDWQTAVDKAQPHGAVAVAATDPLYILYTSGTTGKPKGVVRDNGGHAVAMHYSMRTVYGMSPGDVFWAASDVGWVVGHSYIVYAPLILGCSTVLYEGKPIRTPNAEAFWRVCQDYKVNALFAAPTAFRAIRKEDPQGEGLKSHDLSALKKFFLAGERLDPPTYQWLNQVSGLPVYDHWWQTETGWAIACNPIGLTAMPVKEGCATVATPGYQIKILRDDGSEANAQEQGNIAIQLPLPPGCFTTLWQDDERYCSSYFSAYPGYYLSGDGGFIDDDGYVFVMGRIDDVINVAGHRLSTGEMEEVVAAHPQVAECAVLGVQDTLKGELPIAFVVLQAEADQSLVKQQLVQRIRDQIGAIACLKEILIVARLPKTRSGKILRRTLRQIYQHEPYTVPSTIDDPAILDEVKAGLAQ
ncbi:AMP-binding protein [Pleionea litopenaei]|uniref:AMP-binding protein n=1 Tax=Pleionea litopenaei TaxID=3070815 RepID=A0AA51RQA1_9GAMM|nr:AMP-binding protein [Pleionea sp. HL-JVS1]WMS85558.1 AMP-binding protein [Pleionea sp. HL-JVS1]